MEYDEQENGERRNNKLLGTCVNFSRSVQDSVARGFCHELAQMYQISGMVFNPEPVTPIHGARPDQVEKARKTLYKEVTNKLKGKELELPVDISPKEVLVILVIRCTLIRAITDPGSFPMMVAMSIPMQRALSQTQGVWDMSWSLAYECE
jgi:hypothetical protein